MSDQFDPYYTWLGIPPEEQPADHYRLLGVRRFESNAEVLINASDQRMAYLRTFQVGKRGPLSQQLLNEVAAAQACLLDPAKKRQYDDQLRRQDAAKRAAEAPAAVIPVAMPTPLPRAQPISPPAAVASVPAPFVVRNIPSKPALLSSPQPVVHRQSALLTRPLLLIGGSSVVALAVLIIGAVTWANWPRSSRQVVITPATSSAADPPRAVSPPRSAVKVPSIAPAITPPEAPMETPPTPAATPPASQPPEPAATAEPVPSSKPSSPPSPPTVAPQSAVDPPQAEAPPSSAPLLDPAAVELVFDYENYPGPLCLKIAPRGKWLTFGPQHDSAGVVVDIEGGRSYFSTLAAGATAFSDDGALYAVAMRNMHQGADSLFLRRSAEPWRQVISRPDFQFRNRVKALAFSPDKRILFAACGADEKLLALNVVNNLTPMPAFQTRLPSVEWVGVAGDILACQGAGGSFELFSIRDRKRVVRIDLQPFEPGGPLLMIQRAPRTSSLLHFIRGECRTETLSGSGGRQTQPIPEVANAADVLALGPKGDLAAFKVATGLVLWSLAEQRELTRIQWQEELEFGAISRSDGLLAVGGRRNRVVVFQMDKLLVQPHWRLPNQSAWTDAGYPQPVSKVVLTRGGDVPPAGELAGRAVPAGPMGRPYDVAAARAAIAALRARGIDLPDDPERVYFLHPRDKELDREVIKQLDALPRLQHLDLSRCPSAALVLKEMPLLAEVRTVNMRGAPVTDDDLVHLAKAPQLQFVDLTDAPIRGPGLAHLAPLSELKTVSLPNGLDRSAAPHLARLVQLRHVNLWPKGLIDDDLEAIGLMTRLESVQLGNAQLEGHGLAHLRNLKQVKSLGLPPAIPSTALVHLKAFDLERFDFPPTSDDAAVAHLAHMTRLKWVGTSSQMTDEALQTLARLGSVETLMLAASSRMTGEGLAHLAEMPALKEVYLGESIGDAGLKSLARCQRLERLDLVRSRCTDAGLAALAAAPSLSGLTLGPSFTDGCVEHCAKLRNLESLGLFDAAITAKGLTDLSKCRQLRRLNLAQIDIGDAELAALKRLSQLESLMIQHFRLSDMQRVELQQALPNCRLSN